jgi:hypothetical protein
VLTALPAQISASNFHDLTQITQRRVRFNPKRTEKPKAHGFSVRFGLKHTLPPDSLFISLHFNNQTVSRNKLAKNLNQIYICQANGYS